MWCILVYEGSAMRGWNWWTQMFQKKILYWSPRIPWGWGSSSETSDLPSILHDCHKVRSTNMKLHSQKTTANRRILQLPKEMCEEWQVINKTIMHYPQIQEFKTVSNRNLQSTQTLLHAATLFHKVKRHHLSAETGSSPPPLLITTRMTR